MPLTKPIQNNALVEVLREDDGVSRTDENESMKHGRLVRFSLDRYHLTASAAIEFSDKYLAEKHEQLSAMVGSIVRWEEFAEGGQTFEEGGKTYASIPWWRLITEKENANE